MISKTKQGETESREGLKGGVVQPETWMAEGAVGMAGDPESHASGGNREEDLTFKIQEMEKKAADNYDKYVRAAAELDNYKKRAVRDKADAIKYGNENLLRDILPIVDNLDRALEHVSSSDDFEAFKKGLKMLHEQLLCCLKKHGVEMIDAVGKDFDPNVHEAMLQVASDEHEASKVVSEFERGYLLNGRLLRPAKVCVCKR